MMRGLPAFLSALERHELSRLVLQSRDVVEGNLAGRHRSPVRGASTEFADHRAYIPGDDPRRLDWKVLGRTERYFVRRYQDETNLRVYLAIDRSASMGYGSGAVTKFQYACRLAAALGFIVCRNRDSVGLYLYSDRVDAAVGARNSLSHLNNLLKVLQDSAPASTTATAPALHRVADDIHRRALLILMSDLFDDTEGVVRALAHFRKERHDVILLHVLDPREMDFAFEGGGEFVDLETGERRTADPEAIGHEYRHAFGGFLDEYRQACSRLRIDYRLARTDVLPTTFLRAYLEERRRLLG